MPDSFCYTTLLNACQHAEKWKLVSSLQQANIQASIQPNIVSLTTVARSQKKWQLALCSNLCRLQVQLDKTSAIFFLICLATFDAVKRFGSHFFETCLEPETSKDVSVRIMTHEKQKSGCGFQAYVRKFEAAKQPPQIPAEGRRFDVVHFSAETLC